MAFMDQFRQQPQQYQPQQQQAMPPQMAQALQTCQGMLQAANGDVGAAVRSLSATNPAFAEVIGRNRGKTAAQAFRDETGLDPNWVLSLFNMGA